MHWKGKKSTIIICQTNKMEGQRIAHLSPSCVLRNLTGFHLAADLKLARSRNPCGFETIKHCLENNIELCWQQMVVYESNLHSHNTTFDFRVRRLPKTYASVVMTQSALIFNRHKNKNLPSLGTTTFYVSVEIACKAMGVEEYETCCMMPFSQFWLDLQDGNMEACIRKTLLVDRLLGAGGMLDKVCGAAKRAIKRANRLQAGLYKHKAACSACNTIHKVLIGFDINLRQ
jgi:hypothetical protein